ncbi:acetoacetate--CoA ligase [Pseudomonadota bacterium]
MSIKKKPIWAPSQTRIAQANLSDFIRQTNSTQNKNIQSYNQLYQWSIDAPDAFWPTVWKYCGVKASKLWSTVLADKEKMPGAKWFQGARLNFAENLLYRNDDKAAIIFWGEDRYKREISYKELNSSVAQLAAAMRDLGITTGDRVAAFMPNMPETVIAMLATSSLGAIWSSCSPDFGVNGAVERFGQIEPKLLFCADGYLFKSKEIDSLQRINEITQRVPSIRKTVVVPYINSSPDITPLSNSVQFDDFIAGHNNQALSFIQLPFDHPLYILYSSGTTGLPKCIVHGAGGTLLQHLKELVLHTDVHEEDRIFYFTTCGWMMWNWLVSGLATGATIMLYDGSPLHPNPEVLFDYAEAEGISIFGTSAKYLSALEKSGARPAETHNLSALKTILTTGSPLAPESFDYVYRNIKTDVQLSSISGGTDIVSCFALGNPLLPVYKGELQCRGLGMKVAIYDENGHAVKNQQGELVCEAPAPSMPIYFWNDDNNTRYKAAYFARFPGVWAHGDYAGLTDADGLIIYGRSDAVLNPGGVRIGTAEIYRQVEKLDEVVESIAVGQQWQDDVRIILFVKLRESASLNDALIQKIKTTIRKNTTPRHVPAKVIQVADIPRTISGKIVELSVRNVIHNRPVTNTEALANPEVLELYKGLDELQKE